MNPGEPVIVPAAEEVIDGYCRDAGEPSMPDADENLPEWMVQEQEQQR